MKTTKYSCANCAGGTVPVLHDVEKLHAEVCQAVETKTIGAAPYVLVVTNPVPLPDADNPSGT